jgi:hypothetical protein
VAHFCSGETDPDSRFSVFKTFCKMISIFKMIFRMLETLGSAT